MAGVPIQYFISIYFIFIRICICSRAPPTYLVASPCLARAGMLAGALDYWASPTQQSLVRNRDPQEQGIVQSLCAGKIKKYPVLHKCCA